MDDLDDSDPMILDDVVVSSSPSSQYSQYSQSSQSSQHSQYSQPSSSSSSSSVLESTLAYPPSPKKAWSSSFQYSDRFIPVRHGLELDEGFTLLNDQPSTRVAKPTDAAPRRHHTLDKDLGKEESMRTFNLLLRSELFGDESIGIRSEDVLKRKNSPVRNLLQYKSPKKQLQSVDSPTREAYSVTPLSAESQKLLLSQRKTPRHIPNVPVKVLDAPELEDDFYLNLVDWSSKNVLAVGLGENVYLWSAHNSQVTKLCSLQRPADRVTSVGWMQSGSHLAVGTNRGMVQLWDVEARKRIRIMEGHTNRVGCLAWNSHVLTSGSRDRNILQRDVRQASPFYSTLSGHKQEVCGLKWSPDGKKLASGGNDNKLLVWDLGVDTPAIKFSDHQAAVKAIAWSPHQHGLLASGGGTADKRIRFWNTLVASSLQSVDTGSQVCNITWSKTSNELVSTHGYSQNQVIVWKYPSMEAIATLTGHLTRVLYLAMSPDGLTIVTGAGTGDETLRFWNVFAKAESTKDDRSPLDPFGQIR